MDERERAPTPEEGVAKGQVWEDDRGTAVVLAVEGEHAMLRRRRGNPFIASLNRMTTGQDGWRRVKP